MLVLDVIAENRIREAQERGDFDDLPGAGAPLELDDDTLVPEDLRVAHRILKNAGLLPLARRAGLPGKDRRATQGSIVPGSGC